MRSCSTAGRSAGGLVSLGPGVITLASAEGAKHELPLDQVFKLTREFRGSVAAIDRSMIVLPEGDCLMRVTVGTATETALACPVRYAGQAGRSARRLRGMDHGGAGGQTDALDGLWDRVRLEPRKEEVVWLSNGDRLSGGFLGWDERKIKMQVSGKPWKSNEPGSSGSDSTRPSSIIRGRNRGSSS